MCVCFVKICFLKSFLFVMCFLAYILSFVLIVFGVVANKHVNQFTHPLRSDPTFCKELTYLIEGFVAAF